MTDHTRTEKIGGDSNYFCDHPSRVGNCYDSLATPLGNKRVRPISSHMLSFILLRILNLSVSHFCDEFVASFIYVLIIVVSFIVLIVNKSRSSLREHSRAFT